MIRRLVGILLIGTLLALASAWYRRQHAIAFCQFDNNRIEPVYEVDLIANDDARWRFCSVYCASQWWQRSRRDVREIIVRDEVTGKPLDASLATFVESDVVTYLTHGDRVHVFADPEQAQRHAKQYRGRVVPSLFAVQSGR
jgi:hypothetical protein